MQLLVSPIENLILSEETSFSADEAVGQTEISCKNAKNISANDFIILGIIGSETAEIIRVSEVASNLTSITLITATKFEHLKDSPIKVIRYNQRKFYRSTTETGTYSHLSDEGSPIDIQVDKPEGTEFEDSSGLSTSWYKATYYNSNSGLESTLADAIAAKASDVEHYTSIFKIKDEAGFKNNSYIDSDLIDRYRLEAEAQAEGAVANLYQLPFSSQPKIFQHITTLLAAGLLIAKEYGLEDDTEISKTGQRKIERAEELLTKISDGKIILLDSNSNQLSKNTDVMSSCSNKYDSDKYSKGVFVTLADEHFRAVDPSDDNASTLKSTKPSTGFK